MRHGMIWFDMEAIRTDDRITSVRIRMPDSDECYVSWPDSDARPDAIRVGLPAADPASDLLAELLDNTSVFSSAIECDHGWDAEDWAERVRKYLDNDR